jgi:hypothetical protein
VDEKRHREPVLGLENAVDDHMGDDQHDDVRREVVGPVVVELGPARLAPIDHLEEAPEKPAAPAGGASLKEAALESGDGARPAGAGAVFVIHRRSS